MTTISKGMFNTQILSPQEEAAGLLLTPLQRKILGNLRAEAAEIIVQVSGDYDKPDLLRGPSLAKQQGKIEILSYLLLADDELRSKQKEEEDAQSNSL